MNTTAKALVVAIVTVATVAISMGTEWPSHESQADVVQLERVVVLGKRATASSPLVAQLPRVVITGRSATSANALQVADAEPLRRAI